MKIFHTLLFLLLFSLSAHLADAKIFKNTYISFEMPDNWKCKSFGTDYVCHSTLSKRQKEAMIILTAKLAGPLDNLNAYLSFLKQPRPNMTRSKQSFKSKAIHSKQTAINNHLWIDSLHKESEIPNYFTRYLVTVCCDNQASKLGILVTYSAHIDHYTKYASDFLKSINSLRVLDVKKALGELQALGVSDSLGTFNPGSYIEDILGNGDATGEEDSLFFGLTTSQLSIFLIIILVIAGYLVIRTRKKKSRSRRRKSRKK